jgi:hypothetical protein
MLTAASLEFVSLCRLQIDLLVQGLGASQGGVYLTETWQDGLETRLVHLVSYPELDEPEENLLQRNLPLISPSIPIQREFNTPQLLSKMAVSPGTASEALQRSMDKTTEPLQRQLVLPLRNNTEVLGLLVVSRDDRPWATWEQLQIDKVAQTIAIACVLDQKSQWLTEQPVLLSTSQHDLLGDVLHQLRSPLSALRTFGKLLLKRLQPTDPNRDFAGGIIRESDHLQDLLQKLDEIAYPQLQASAPKLLSPGTNQTSLLSGPELPSESTIVLSPSSVWRVPTEELGICTIHDILTPLMITAQAMAVEQGLMLHADIPDVLPPVFVSRKALREVLSNIIDNAFKYTPRGGTVWVQGFRCSAEQCQPLSTGDTLAIAISDTGPGIPIQDQAHVFDRHYRGVQAEGAIIGSGLGLAISRELVRQMQGDIQVFSPALNRLTGHIPTLQAPGSTFVIWLPTKI